MSRPLLARVMRPSAVQHMSNARLETRTSTDWPDEEPDPRRAWLGETLTKASSDWPDPDPDPEPPGLCLVTGIVTF